MMGISKINLSWSVVEDLIYKFTVSESSFLSEVTDIVAPVRGGLCPAVILSHKLHSVKVHAVPISYRDAVNIDLARTSSILQDLNSFSTLIVDDIADTGLTLATISAQIFKSRIFVLCAKSQSFELVHYYGMEVGGDVWVKFPWES